MKIKALISSFALLTLSGCQIADLTANDNSTSNSIDASGTNNVSALQSESQSLKVKEVAVKAKSAKSIELHYVVGTFQKLSNTDSKSIAPNDKELHYVIGTFYMDAGENEKATESLKNALMPSIAFKEALNYYGLHFDKLATDKLSQNKLYPSIALNYKDPNFEKLMSLSSQYFKESIAKVERFIQENPNQNEVHSLLPPLRRALKNTERALEYKKRLDAEP
jgi:tetratricopeptide (TPR) repeat protein